MNRLVSAVLCMFTLAVIVPRNTSAARAAPDKGPFRYLSPRPGADWISPQSKITFRRDRTHTGAGWRDAVTVTGSVSGTITGRWILASDGETSIFDPARAFAPGERIEVAVGPESSRFTYAFTIAPSSPDPPEPRQYDRFTESLPEPATAPPPARPQPGPRMSSMGYELPEAFPDLSILADDGRSEGFLFLAPYDFRDNFPRGTPPRYLIILDEDNEPVFFRPCVPPYALDFKMLDDGRLSFFNYLGDYYIMDDTYSIVDTVSSHGYTGNDGHDIQVLPNGNFLVIGYHIIIYDMSAIVEGGRPNARIVDMVIQEVDGDDNVLFEWRSWDHFSPLDAVGYDITGRRVDFVHTNAVEVDHDGRILLSQRNLDEITKIDRDTGEIVWHLGGKNNDFTLIGDGQWFTHQHSIRRLPGGTVTLFDNGNTHDPPESRAVEYALDEEAMTITQIWEYRHDPPIFAPAMGNVQRLDDGSTLINWGFARPHVTEVRPDGSTGFEMVLPRGMFTYRAFRFDWHGVAARPDLWETIHDNTLALNFVKFGDDRVAAYNIYRGDERVRTTTGNRVVVHGFDAGETLRFRVTAVDRRGTESPFSNEITVTPEFSDHRVEARLAFTPRALEAASEGNRVYARLDFPAGCDCAPSGAVEDVVLGGAVTPDRMTVQRAGDAVQRIDLAFPRAAVLELVDGGEAVAVTVTGRVGDVAFTGTDVIKVMESKSLGPSAGPEAPAAPGFVSISPNPFNPTTVIRYRAAAGARVTIAIFDVAGRRVRSLVDGAAAGGEATVTWDGHDNAGRAVASGVYFCRLQAGPVAQTRKLVLMK